MTPAITPGHPRAVQALLHALGAQVVQLPADFGNRQHADASRMACAEPIALLRPVSTAQIAQALRICSEHRQPIVTQGGLTGLSGGACLRGGEIALSMERMRGIESIDMQASTMTVLAGTPLQMVQQAAEAAGAMFPLDLGARGSCSIGGNLATNAGGNRVIKYGMARDQVLDIEVVLPGGQVLGGRHRMIKNNTGYDLRHLFIGSEGTLGVITKAVLKLRPKPTAVSTAFCGVPDFAAVIQLLTRAQSELPAGVSAFEVMWPGYYHFVLERLPHLRAPLARRHAFYLLLESSGADAERQNQAFECFLAKCMADGLLQDAAIAGSDADALAFWAIRDAPGEYQRILPGRVSFDISFAISDVEAAIAHCEAALRERWPKATVLIYGHLGDGNIHIVVQEPDWPAGSMAEVQSVVYGITGQWAGSVSAEHGIGLKRKPVLGLTRSAIEIDVMRAIKRAIDPDNLLNPGKLLDC
ncbi:FAD-binding oxidoreductase [Verminephrobacter eiseniae]|uniref:FAD linked oxidase domain protein n=1 Tax=Verminephrobacter eiseniae (strain EF01-2) TaxID=391735 RepID=A1WJM5_VEREI|nr:FAD-binding oxidoreductase [Verminephrobacter eiseniae]ABM57832.1 FAD linked oxidase domain protein [Verminephrobacter eiseniae EF01-2]MCW5283440.1 FAD-binding oxidoreductase [Verminephrobacter eiseniae]MCW5301149.1 FAD-binding oxidoreductase [Verminephrobacter eiseniae]MCW8178627.1 FAD-binding oxidoreductase [Verminephrobacter eiseniae]MCW8190209.1 FAD-binding oxidoreductase [Verminephrobacter eiseniae]